MAEIKNLDNLSGLTQQQVEQSRKKNGQNTLTKQKRNSFFKQFLSSFGDPIIKILLVALAINILFMFRSADWYESLGIAMAVFLATFVSTLSEYGSESAFEKLQEEADKVTCRVRRGGKTISVPVADIVVNDIVLLEAGERIPADGIIKQGEVYVEQSPLNGESKEVKKAAGASSDDWDLANKTQVFSGSNVSSGEGAMQVKRVGDSTFYGNMASALQVQTRESPLRTRLASLAKLLSRLGYGAAILVFFADLFNSIVMNNNFDMLRIMAEFQDFSVLFLHIIHAFTLAVTVVVVAVPEGLPMMITIVLSSNMKRMLKSKVLVRKLVGIETAGSMNILFTDKTGTLTKGKLEVNTIVTGSGQIYKNFQHFKSEKELYNMYKISVIYNNQSVVSKGKPLGGNATDRAFLSSVLPLSNKKDNVEVKSRVPFDSKNKFSISKISGEKNLTLIKGAPEKILSKCNRYYDKNGKVQTIHNKEKLNEQWSTMTRNKERVIVLATSEKNITSPDETSTLTLVAIVSIKDEIRTESKEAVSKVKKAGIQVVMITGDNKETAAAIAKETGILTADDKNAVYTGEQLRKMTDDEVKKAFLDIRVVARVLPTDKSRLVTLAQQMGLVVGMTGDGINDAPALKKADVGFAMGSGTEVAKEAGDIVIMDNNFKSIEKAILYGRTIFKSIRKFITYQFTMNLCAVGVSVIGPLIGVDTPVTVIQMLWVNIIMDALGGLAFSGEAALPEYMHEPPKSLYEPILNKNMLKQILYMGICTIALCVTFLKNHVAHNLFSFNENDTTHFMTCFFALFIFCGIFNSFNARTERLNLFAHMGENPRFIIIMSFVAIIQIFFVYFGGSLFRTVGIPFNEIFKIILIAMLVIPAEMLRKFIIGRKNRKKKIKYNNTK